MKRSLQGGDRTAQPHKRARVLVPEQPCHLLDLDDKCLLGIFMQLTPLPDLFQVAAVCKRFKALTMDGRLWLSVSQLSGEERRRSWGSRCWGQFRTLQAAVQASRPGDTIVLQQGQVHAAQDVVIPWPLQLRGGGAAAEDTTLLCRGPDAALDFRSSGKVANLAIHSTLAACVVHWRGRVTIDGCSLQCHARGLEHLISPLVTAATCSIGAGRGSPRSQAVARRLTSQQRRSAGCMPGAGVLQVLQTKIMGGADAVAVSCCGTGALQQVRVVSLASGTLFWFVVPSGTAGTALAPAPTGLQQPEQRSHVSKMHKPPMLSSEPSSTEQQEEAAADTQPAEAVLLQRSKAWAAAQHAQAISAAVPS